MPRIRAVAHGVALYCVVSPTRDLRHLVAALRLNCARSAHTTDAAAILVLAAGLITVLGLRAFGFERRATPRLSIVVQPDCAQRVASMLRERDIGPGEFLIALSPATSGTNRRLEPGLYAQFVHRIRRSHGTRTLLLGSPGDRELTRAILSGALSGTVDLAGETSVGLLAATIARCRTHPTIGVTGKSSAHSGCSGRPGS